MDFVDCSWSWSWGEHTFQIKQCMTVHMGASTHDGLYPSTHIRRFFIHFTPTTVYRMPTTHASLGRAAPCPLCEGLSALNRRTGLDRLLSTDSPYHFAMSSAPMECEYSRVKSYGYPRQIGNVHNRRDERLLLLWY